MFHKTIRAALISTALICASSETRAADTVNYCHSLPELAKNVKSCGQNVFFSKAAQVCLGKLEHDLAAKKALLTAAMAARGAAAGSAQAARIENNSSNLVALRTSIEELTGYAVHARREVINYSASFDLAGPFSEKQAEKIGIAKLLKGFPCFKNNRAVLAGVVSSFDGRIKEFHDVIASAKALEGKTALSLTKLDSSTVNAKAANRAPASAMPAYPAPPPVEKKGPSSITGTEKIGESEKAMQEILGK